MSKINKLLECENDLGKIVLMLQLEIFSSIRRRNLSKLVLERTNPVLLKSRLLTFEGISRSSSSVVLLVGVHLSSRSLQ